MLLNGFIRFSVRKKRVLGIVFVCVSILYPFLVYFGLSHVGPSTIVVILLCLLACRTLWSSEERGLPIRSTSVIALAGIAGLFLIDSVAAVRAYPVLINLGLALVFALSLMNPPSAIERIARLTEPTLDDFGVAYTRKVTWVWLAFFLGNGTISVWTAVYGTLDQWTLYNGVISYLLIVLLFAGEYLVRRTVRSRAKT